MAGRNQESAREWGKLLRKAREEAGLTQEGLAQRLGLSVTTISRWETGVAVPKNYEALDISQLLHTPTHTPTPPEPPLLKEALEQVRFLWAATQGEGPAWEHLTKQLSWIRHAMKWGLRIERRKDRKEGRSA